MAQMTAPCLTLDISRLLSRSGEAVPTGIDRVELAYAEYLMREAPERTEFVALHPLGRFGALNFEVTSWFIRTLSERWNRATEDDGRAARAGRRVLHRQILLGPDRSLRAAQGRSAYLLLSHHHLTRPRVIARTLSRRPTAFVPMVHDLIPSDYPEYARPKEPAKHLRRIETVARFADGILVPSQAVRQSVLPHLQRAGRSHVPVQVVAHGVHLPDIAPGPVARAGRPYFVCLGTIEPRKNHLLLLNIWRRLVEVLGEKAPRLILVGKRGWENENVIDMIERCPALQGVVEEHSALPDEQVTQLLLGARALLFPSFVEGFGLPLAETLALGVKVVCSDIPVFREIAGDAAEFLDPLDGLGWMQAIIRRTFEENVEPTIAWQANGWQESVEDAMRFVESVASALV
jgi:glycosyltransferase involved in cell wall biosynthesis